MLLLKENAYHITTAGQITEIRPANGVDFKLEEVQNRVEGYIEVVWLNDEQIMIVNEEGKFDKPYNPFATAIAQLHGVIGAEDYICGNVVLCPTTMLH